MPPLQLRPDAVASPATELHLEELPPAAPRAVRPGPAPILPLAPDRYKVQFTATADLHDKLERLMALTRSSDLAAVIEQAVNEKLERLEARRFAKTKPRKGLAKADSSPYSRHIPAPVRRAVYERDGGQCRYVDKQGRRCVERSRLEYHHRRPFGLGGDRHSENICLMCRTHNQYLAECDYGRAVLEAARTRSRSTLRAVSP